MNPSHLSRAELVAELLSTSPSSAPSPASVADLRESAWLPAPEDLVRRKLAIAREMLLRDLRAQMRRGPIMDSPGVVRDWLRMRCAGLQHEVFLVLYLSANHALIDAVEMFRGTLTQTPVYPREIVKAALARNCTAVVLAHNHPSSGSPEPSASDTQLTQCLRQALAVIDVQVLDHLIVAGEHVLSFAERGML